MTDLNLEATILFVEIREQDGRVVEQEFVASNARFYALEARANEMGWRMLSTTLPLSTVFTRANCSLSAALAPVETGRKSRKAVRP